MLFHEAGIQHLSSPGGVLSPRSRTVRRIRRLSSYRRKLGSQTVFEVSLSLYRTQGSSDHPVSGQLEPRRIVTAWPRRSAAPERGRIAAIDSPCARTFPRRSAELTGLDCSSLLKAGVALERSVQQVRGHDSGSSDWAGQDRRLGRLLDDYAQLDSSQLWFMRPCKDELATVRCHGCSVPRACPSDGPEPVAGPRGRRCRRRCGRDWLPTLLATARSAGA